MSAIVLDPVLRSKLNDLSQSFELKDQDGIVVGRFLPEQEYRRIQYELAMAACPYSKEQLKEFSEQKDGTTLEEFWKKMGVS